MWTNEQQPLKCRVSLRFWNELTESICLLSHRKGQSGTIVFSGKLDSALNVSRTQQQWDIFCIVLWLSLYTYVFRRGNLCLNNVFICHVAHWSKSVTWYIYFLLNTCYKTWYKTDISESYRRIGYSSIAVIAKCVITPSEVLFKQYYVTDKAGFRTEYAWGRCLFGWHTWRIRLVWWKPRVFWRRYAILPKFPWLDQTRLVYRQRYTRCQDFVVSSSYIGMFNGKFRLQWRLTRMVSFIKSLTSFAFEDSPQFPPPLRINLS